MRFGVPLLKESVAGLPLLSPQAMVRDPGVCRAEVGFLTLLRQLGRCTNATV
jgi:hypothetical protein